MAFCGEHITFVACAPDSAGRGETLVFGTNSCMKAGCHEREFFIREPQPLMIGLGKVPWSVRHVACGEHHTAFMTCSGQLFTAGRNDYGQLGLDSTAPWARTLSEVPLRGKVARGVACGRDYTLLVAADGIQLSLWACGNNHCDQLALDSAVEGLYVIRFVEVDTSHLQVLRPAETRVRVACGETHSVVAWGDVLATTGVGGMGLGDASREAHRLNVLPEQPWVGHTITDLAAGWDHTVVGVCTTEREFRVYTWGQNGFGQMGFPEWKICKSPVRVDFEFCKRLPRRFSSMIVAHAMNTIVMVEGRVWTFGWTDLTDPASRACAFRSYMAMNCSTTPKLVDPGLFGGARVATVSAGLQHSAFVTVDGSLYMYGSMNPKHAYKENWHAEDKGDMKNNGIPTAVAGRQRSGSRYICERHPLLRPTLVSADVLRGNVVGAWHMGSEKKMAAVMGLHPRIGKASVLFGMHPEIVRTILDFVALDNLLDACRDATAH
jgi:alpha-tubulin suppressor-like RCC1 family protein